MKKIIPIALLAMLGCGMAGCNGSTQEKTAPEQAEQPATENVYKLVQVREDGTEQVEEMKAKDDTVAVTLFLDRVEKSVMANIDKETQPYKAMYLVSSKGDTLNNDDNLLKAVMEKQSHAPQAPAAPLK